MEPSQLLTLIMSSTVVGAVVMQLINVGRDALAGHLKKRRAEVDAAIAERDKARAVSDLLDQWADILEESLRLHRRRMIDAPCIDPDAMPPYPTRPRKGDTTT